MAIASDVLPHASCPLFAPFIPSLMVAGQLLLHSGCTSFMVAGHLLPHLGCTPFMIAEHLLPHLGYTSLIVAGHLLHHSSCTPFMVAVHLLPHSGYTPFMVAGHLLPHSGCIPFMVAGHLLPHSSCILGILRMPSPISFMVPFFHDGSIPAPSYRLSSVPCGYLLPFPYLPTAFGETATERNKNIEVMCRRRS